MTKIQQWLFAHRDEAYQALTARLIPTIDPDRIIGVRTPALRAYAKQLIKEHRSLEVTAHLPHDYYEENQLHAFLLSELKQYDRLISELERFLPYIDNWATCDQLRPSLFKRHTDQLHASVMKWLNSDQTYTIRFGLGMLNSYFLEDAFSPDDLAAAARIKSPDYYVNMMLSWYLATALAKQYDAVIPLFQQQTLDPWVHNKAIQKARESRRVSETAKELLATLRRPSVKEHSQ